MTRSPMRKCEQEVLEDLITIKRYKLAKTILQGTVHRVQDNGKKKGQASFCTFQIMADK